MLRGSTPQHMVVALILIWMLSKLVRICSDKSFVKWLTRWHWFVGASLYILVLLILAVRSAFVDILLESEGLDPKVVAKTVNMTMLVEWDSSWEEWEKDASLEKYPFLRWFSLVSFFWVILTWVVCVFHIRKHAGAMAGCVTETGERSARFFLHDNTIRILLLPVVYGLMSFHAVVYQWGVIFNVTEDKHWYSWKQRSHYYSEMYESAFYVGDIYESYALLVLGELIMNVLERRVESLEEKAAPAIEESRSSQDVQMSALFISAFELYNEMKELTTFGIKWFCWTCGLQALYHLGVAGMGYYHLVEPLFGLGDAAGQGKGILQQDATQEKSMSFFYGAGCVASFAAIGNIMKVETAFRMHLREFQPFWKFWGTKMLVSIAFLQSMALSIMPPFCWWSETRVNLFYASLLCLECFLVSLIHLAAWSHTQRWYGCRLPPGADRAMDDYNSEEDHSDDMSASSSTADTECDGSDFDREAASAVERVRATRSADAAVGRRRTETFTASPSYSPSWVEASSPSTYDIATANLPRQLPAPRWSSLPSKKVRISISVDGRGFEDRSGGLTAAGQRLKQRSPTGRAGFHQGRGPSRALVAAASSPSTSTNNNNNTMSSLSSAGAAYLGGCQLSDDLGTDTAEGVVRSQPSQRSLRSADDNDNNTSRRSPESPQVPSFPAHLTGSHAA